MSILTLLAGLLLVLFMILWLPLTFQGQVQQTEKFKFNGKISWAGGLLCIFLIINQDQGTFLLKLGGWTKTLQATRTGKPPAKETKKMPPGNKLQTIKPYLRKELITGGFRFFSRLLRALNLRFQLSGEYGTDDPALTGFLMGLLATFNNHPEINLCPNFTEPVLDLQGEVEGKMVPAIFLWLTIRFLLSSPVRPLWLTRKHALRH